MSGSSSTVQLSAAVCASLFHFDHVKIISPPIVLRSRPSPMSSREQSDILRSSSPTTIADAGDGGVLDGCRIVIVGRPGSMKRAELTQLITSVDGEILDHVDDFTTHVFSVEKPDSSDDAIKSATAAGSMWKGRHTTESTKLQASSIASLLFPSVTQCLARRSA